MGGIRVLMLRRDFTVTKMKFNSSANHVHFGKGSYLNMESAILARGHKKPPVLIFQEGNATPKGFAKIATEPKEPKESQQKQNPLENVKWDTWYIPMLRGLNRQHHSRFSLNFGKIFNKKTLPFLIIGFALLLHFASGGA